MILLGDAMKQPVASVARAELNESRTTDNMQKGGLLSKLLWLPTTMEFSWVAASEPAKVFVTNELASVRRVIHKTAFVNCTNYY